MNQYTFINLSCKAIELCLRYISVGLEIQCVIVAKMAHSNYTLMVPMFSMHLYKDVIATKYFHNKINNNRKSVLGRT